MRRPGQEGDTCRNTPGLSRLYELARMDAQRPGNIGAGLKVLDMLMARPGFRVPHGGHA